MEYLETRNRGHYQHLPAGAGSLSTILSCVCVCVSMVNERGAHHRPSKTVICPFNYTFLGRLLTFPDRFRVERSNRHDAKCRTRPLPLVQWLNVEQMVSWKHRPTTPFLTSSFYFTYIQPALYLLLLLLQNKSSPSSMWCRLAASYKNATRKRRWKQNIKTSRFCHAKHAGHCGNTSLM